MKAATKKLFRNLLAVMVSVCMVCTLTPAVALATSGDPMANEAWTEQGTGASGSADATGSMNTSGIVDENGKASAESSIYAKVYDTDFAFASIRGAANYTDKNNLKEGLAVNPLTAVFGVSLDDLKNTSFTVEWGIEEVTPDEEATSTTASVDKWVPVDGTYVSLQKTEYSAGSSVPINGSGFPEFTYGGSDTAQIDTLANAVQEGKCYRVSITLTNDSDDSINGKASAFAIITLKENYKHKIIAGTPTEQAPNANEYSIEGDVFTQFSIPDFTAPELVVVPVPADGNNAADGEINAALGNLAGKDGNSIIGTTSLSIGGLENLPEGEPAYMQKLTVRMPLPDELSELNDGATVDVYSYADGGKTSKVTAVVATARDEDGNEISGARVVEFQIEGTGADLGVFAIGFPDSSRYTITSTAENGQITPSYDSASKGLGGTDTIEVFQAYSAVPGFLFAGFDLKVNGTAKNISDLDLGHNVFRFNPKSYGVKEGDHVTITAIFEEVAEADVKDCNVTVSLSTDDGATGNLTFLSPNDKDFQTRTVNMGRSEGPVTVKSNNGLLLTFNTNKNAPTSKVKSVTINNKEVAFEGNSLLIAALSGTTRIDVKYEKGTPDPVVEHNINVVAKKRPNGNQPAYIIDDEGNQVAESTFTTENGVITITAEPQPNNYKLAHAYMYVGDPETTTPTDIYNHIGSTITLDTVNLYNVVDEITIELVYEPLPAYIEVEVTNPEGQGEGGWGWIIDDDEDSGSFFGARTFSTFDIRPMAGEFLQQGELNLVPTETNPYPRARLVVPAKVGYVLSALSINGHPVKNLMTKHTNPDNGETVYTLTVCRDETESHGNGKWGTSSKTPQYLWNTEDNVFYATGNASNIRIEYDPAEIPATVKQVVNTSVTAFGGGTITPSSRVDRGGTAIVQFHAYDGYEIESIKLNGANLTLNSDSRLSNGNRVLTLQNITSDQDVVVSYKLGTNNDPKSYTITASAGAGGSISPAGSFPWFENEPIDFTFTSQTGYRLSKIVVNGSEVTPSSSSSFRIDRVTEDVDIQVTFQSTTAQTSPAYNVQVVSIGNGAVSPTGSFMYAAGSNIDLTVIPAENFYTKAIRAYYGSSASTGTNSGVNVISFLKNDFSFSMPDIQEDVKIEVEFAECGEGTPENPGTPSLIEPNPGNSHIGSGATLTPAITDIKPVEEGNTGHADKDQTFTVRVSPSYELTSPGIVIKDGNTVIAESMGDKGEASGVKFTDNGGGIYTVTVPKDLVTGDLAIDVNTKPVDNSTESVVTTNVLVRVAGDGMITPGMTEANGVDGSVAVEVGKNQTFNFIPKDKNWKLRNVYVNGKEVTVTNNTYTWYNIQKPEAGKSENKIEAVFTKIEDGETPVNPPVTHDVKVEYLTTTPQGTASPTLTKVINGNPLTITVKPNAGYRAYAYTDKAATKQLTIVGGAIELENITKDQTIYVTFEQDNMIEYVDLTVNVTNGGGTTYPNGTIQVVKGSQQNISFVPDADNKVKTVKVNGSDVTLQVRSNSTYTLTSVTANTRVDVEYCDKNDDSGPKPNLPAGETLDQFDVTSVVPNGGGSVTPSSTKVNRGGTATLTVTPLKGYKLTSLKANGAPIAVQNETAQVPNITSNTTVEAIFSKIESATSDTNYTVIASVSGNVGGTISPAGAITVPAGGTQSFTIIPDPGYKVQSLVVSSDGVQEGTPQNFTGGEYKLFSVNANKNMIVTFVPLDPNETGTQVATHTITATSTVNGRISPEGSIKVADGGTGTFSFIPEKNCMLSYVIIDKVPITAEQLNSKQYIFAGVNEDHSIHAVFIPNDEDVEYKTVTAGTPSYGSITPSSQLVKKGSSHTLTIAPMFGYKVSDIKIDGSSISNVDSSNVVTGSVTGDEGNNIAYEWESGKLTLTSVSEDVEVSATFVKDESASATPPSYVPISGETSANPANSGAGGTTTVEGGGGGFIEKPGPGASDAEKHPSVTIVPDNGSTVDEVIIEYGDGSKAVITDDGTREYDKDGKLLDASGNPVSPEVIYSDARPLQGPVTLTTPNSHSVAEAGYVNIDAEKAAETGGVTVDVVFRPIDPAKGDDLLSKPTYYEIVTSASNGGQVFTSGRAKAAEGANVVIQMIANNNYELASLNVDGSDVPLSTLNNTRKYVFPSVNANHTLDATFGYVDSSFIHYDVTASVKNDAGGKVSPEHCQPLENEDIVIVFAPENGFKIKNVIIIGGPDGTKELGEWSSPVYTIRNVTNDMQVEVEYEPTDEPLNWPALLSVTTSVPTGNGSVTPEGTTAKPILVPEGSQYKFDFVPDPGHVIDYVVFNGYRTTLESTATFCSVKPVAGAENNLAVYFTSAASKNPKYHTFTAKAEGGNGTVTPTFQRVQDGFSQTVYIKPAKGYTVKDVTVNGWTKKATPAVESFDPNKYYELYTYTEENIKSDTDVVVTFESIGNSPVVSVESHSITVAMTGSGRVTPLGQQTNIPIDKSIRVDLETVGTDVLGSVWVTEKGAGPNGEDIKTNIYNDALKGWFDIRMGNHDIEVMVNFIPMGQTQLVQAKMGNTTLADGTNVNVSMSLQDRSEVVTYIPVDPTTRYLMMPDGKEIMNFTQNDTYTFYPSLDLNDGKEYVLESVKYAGVEVPITIAATSFEVRMTQDGAFDIVFRERTPDDPIVTPGIKYQVTTKNMNGKDAAGNDIGGTISPEAFTVNLGGSTGGINFLPDDGWMVKKVELVYLDEDGNPLEDREPYVVPPELRKGNTYNVIGVNSNIEVQVTFCEAVNIAVDCQYERGYISPNPSGDYIQVEKGTGEILFVVAPYDGWYVEDVMVNGDSKYSDLQQSNEYASYMAGVSGNDIRYIEHGEGVKGPQLDEQGFVVQNFSNDNLAVMASTSPDADLAKLNGTAAKKGTFDRAYGFAVPLASDNSNTTRVAATFWRPQVAPSEYTITPVVKGSGGRIDPSVAKKYTAGSTPSFNFIANNGYSVRSVKVDGKAINGASLGENGTSYTFSPLNADHTIEVEFGPMQGSSSGTDRIVRVASALAKTGDLTGPVVGAFLVIAALGIAITVFSSKRRKKSMRG